ncbi:MAG: YraN family protein [Paracoccus sp. (in: a-proteobacteria)]|uniref:YraN family protein n=1 Tax=Paracoccus sp. TaxID=267 RepID=UPI0026E06CC9|nr:YraN family protein [Paracoccus sp. (in: a-proteobacteria)]MDO5621037.1 YraN family protein [Paracoccus sp. (in: a-proteobacteria)]
MQVRSLRSQRGALAYASGMMAEHSVAEHYQIGGAQVLAERWRGRGGEIDLIVQDGEETVFVEVKKAATTDLAAWRLNRRQMDRICMAACEYCDSLPTGMLTPMRFDVALVDDFGRIEMIPNAFGEH